MEELNYTVIVESCPEGGYWAYVPALPGCHTQGETLGEVITMSHDAIQGYLANMAEDGERIPVEPKRSDAAAFNIRVAAPQRA